MDHSAPQQNKLTLAFKILAGICIIIFAWNMSNIWVSHKTIINNYTQAKQLGRVHDQLDNQNLALRQYAEISVLSKNTGLIEKYKVIEPLYKNNLNLALSLADTNQVRTRLLTLSNLNDSLVKTETQAMLAMSQRKQQLALTLLQNPTYTTKLESNIELLGQVNKSFSTLIAKYSTPVAEEFEFMTALTSIILFFTFIILIFYTSNTHLKSKTKTMKKESIASEERFKQLGRYDPLTKLPNRFLFQENLKKAIENAKRDNKSFALMYIDVDHFKRINDTLGHESGDLLLQLISKRLQGSARSNDMISRLGGDEFAIIVNGTDTNEVTHIANRILENLKTAFVLHGHQTFCSASIGIAMYSQRDDYSLKQIVQFADIAMYRAKEEGRRCFKFFTKTLDDEIKRQVSVEDELRNALRNNELSVHYQPQINIKKNTVIGFESLLRWRNHNLKQVSPSEFIPIAEESQLIIEIGEWLLPTICNQYQQWRSNHPDLFQNTTLSVNISPLQLESPNLVNIIMNSLQQANISPNLLKTEITETALIKSSKEVYKTLKALSNNKVRVSLDDFGTGYSSMVAVKNYPINELKIDYSFIKDITNDIESAKLVNAIIALAKSLDVEIIAEGVEQKDQVTYLIDQGCYNIQGNYYCKPIPPNEIPQFLRTFYAKHNQPVPTSM